MVIEFQTRGLGSSASCNRPAASMIRSKSLTRVQHSGQSIRWARCSIVLPSSTSAKLFCSSTQFILISPQVCRGSKPRSQLLTPFHFPLLHGLTRSRLSGLFGSIDLEQVPQFHAGLV